MLLFKRTLLASLILVSAVPVIRAQTADKIAAAKQKQEEKAAKRKLPPAPKPQLEDPMVDYRAKAAADWARAKSCRKVNDFASKYRLATYTSRILEARSRLCVSKPPSPSKERVIAPLPPLVVARPPQPPISGLSTINAGDPVRWIIGGKTIQLAGVVGCHPANSMAELNKLVGRRLICTKLSQHYRCVTQDTNEDVARIAVVNGNARPTGEDYENEFYQWRAKVQSSLKSDGPRPNDPQMCLGD